MPQGCGDTFRDEWVPQAAATGRYRGGAMQLHLFEDPHDDFDIATNWQLRDLLLARDLPGDAAIADACGNWWHYGPDQYRQGFSDALAAIGGDSLPDALRGRGAPCDPELAELVESFGATFPEVMGLMWRCIEVLKKAVAP